MSRSILIAIAVLVGFESLSAWSADDDLRATVEALKKEVESLRGVRTDNENIRRELEGMKGASAPTTSSIADVALDSKYGPDAKVTTKTGKLTISGLVQIWYYTIQNDKYGLFGDLTPGVIGGGDTNQTRDNDSFRVRRAELKFSADINECFTGVIMFDPAREALSYPVLPSNLGQVRGRTNETSAAVTNVQTGAGGASRLLKDAYINFHNIIPHHDIQVGQFKAPIGEEGIRAASELDFAERALLTQLIDIRDLGGYIHGTWWQDRAQYWVGAFDGAGNLHGSDGAANDRSDTNDQKDALLRGLIRPLWKNPCWGSLEFTWTSQFGVHGEGTAPKDGNADGDFADTVDNAGEGLARKKTSASRHYASMMYKPGACLTGLWLRGEWGHIRDRNAPLAVRGFPQNTASKIQTAPEPFSITGWYVSAGYKLDETPFAECLPCWVKPFEFAARFERIENVTVGSLTSPATHTDVFASKITSAGINYYLKGNNAKIQAMYNWVNDPSSASHGFREVKNDNFIVNFQVAF